MSTGSGPDFPPEGANSWERLYGFLDPAQIPWNAGRADSDLVRLVDSGVIWPGRALDLGAGLGHDAAFLASKGFQVTAIEISPSAVKLARSVAALSGVEAKIDFRVADALSVDLPTASFVHDRGFFHYLEGEARKAYLDRVPRALSPSGLLLLRTFCDQQPQGLGPRHYARSELLRLFESAFSTVEVRESVFEGAAKAASYCCLFRKK